MLLPDDRLRAALDPVDRAWEDSELPGAAVLAPFFRRGGEDWLLLTKRRDDLRTHPGQVSFPGGACEGTESPAACALRECQEEIGLDPARVTLLGALPTQISSSRYLVHTLVGRFAEGPALRPDPGEVDAILEIPAREVLDPARWELRQHESRGRTYRQTPHFAHGPHVIWGLTGILIHRLIAVLPGHGG